MLEFNQDEVVEVLLPNGWNSVRRGSFVLDEAAGGFSYSTRDPKTQWVFRVVAPVTSLLGVKTAVDTRTTEERFDKSGS